MTFSPSVQRPRISPPRAAPAVNDGKPSVHSALRQQARRLRLSEGAGTTSRGSKAPPAVRTPSGRRSLRVVIHSYGTRAPPNRRIPLYARARIFPFRTHSSVMRRGECEKAVANASAYDCCTARRAVRPREIEHRLPRAGQRLPAQGVQPRAWDQRQCPPQCRGWPGATARAPAWTASVISTSGRAA